MKNIRTNVFETNSSSSHSISISDSDGVLDTIAPDENGNIVLTGGEFGWAWEQINDPLTKANYCAVDVQHNEEYLKMLVDVIKEHTGCNEVILDIGGYIDHESVGNSLIGFKSYQALKNLLFNPNSYIFTGNDNGVEPPNFYDVGRDFNYKYQLEIDGTDLVCKFEDVPSAKDIDEAIESIMERHIYNEYSSIHDHYQYNDDDDSEEVFKEPDDVWKFRPYPMKDYLGNEFDSIANLSQGIIVLFKLKDVYSGEEDVGGGRMRSKYLGEQILKTKELHFRIVPI